MNIVYRVILKVGYNEAYFEFANAESAASFAKDALMHMVSCDDTKKRSYIMMSVVDLEAEKKEQEEE